MKILKVLGVLAGILIALGGVALAYAYRSQRELVYPAPQPARRPSVPGGVVVELHPGGGPVAVSVPVAAVYVPAPTGGPTLVCFHGNGEQVADMTDAIAAFHQAGMGVYAVEYPGYGINPGTPGEAAIMASAEAALGYLRDHLGVPPGKTLLVGRSLGSGVAVELAARGRGAGVILMSPYTSIPDMAAHMIPVLPVRGLVHDRFDSAARAPRVTVPVLILHGAEDTLIPAAMGRRLGTLFPHATVVMVPGAHHDDLFEGHGAELVSRMADFARTATAATP